jgi:hypothetical protein
MIRKLSQIALAFAFGCGATAEATGADKAAAADLAGPIDFKRDIQPIFESRCYECHGAQKQKSGVRFDQKEGAFKDSDSGKPAVLPGKSSESLLIKRVTSTDPEEIMPPKGEKLNAAQIALLKRWIDAGASWPEDPAAPNKHWAYRKPGRPVLPKVKNSRWPKNPIDYFVLARLEKEGLRPSVEAERPVLLRRVSLDLTGLPPTLEEVEAFVADRSPNAYEKVVELLLASPAYGERWARPWLDLARYADTQGYEKDDRRTIWPYRDWVINALNRDVPFDQFTIEQIAGDMLPNATAEQKIATGFHRNTMTNTEGGTDNEEFRYEAIVDRVNTTFAAWMGSTFGCAQCHNHKYDPFTTVEYYRVMAFLNNTEDADNDDEKPTMRVFKPGEEEKLKCLRESERLTEQKLNEMVNTPEFADALVEWEKRVSAEKSAWETLDPTEFGSKGGASLRKNNTKSIIAEGLNPSNDTYLVTAPIGAGRLTGIRLEVLETGPEKALGRQENGYFVLTGFDVAVKPEGANTAKTAGWKDVTADFSEKDFNVTNLLAGTGDGWAVASFKPENKIRRSAYFALSEPVDFAEGGTLTFTLRHSDKHPGANIRRFRLYATTNDPIAPPTRLPDDVRAALAVEEDKRDSKQRQSLTNHVRTVDSRTKPLYDAYASARKEAEEFDKTITRTGVMVELEKPRETRRHVRGGYLSTAEVVTPGSPASLHSFPPNQPLNRLGFAHWLVDANNPLTARVIMNRFWEQYFGRGIVETVEEFGKQGEAPSHPDLLDWLACEFMEPSAPVKSLNSSNVKSGGDSTIQPFHDLTIERSPAWSLKHMHRVIVTSATYRQSSKVSPALLQRDPYDRLLARGPRVRLEAEMVRDQALAVSGLLSRKVGGPSVMPPQPDGLWMVVYNGDKWETSKGEDKYRRGLYTFWRRSNPHPVMTAFDAPSREFCVLKRNRSDTPLQALATLNDPAFVEAAQALARNVASKENADVKERATYAFRVVLCRVPRAKEVERLVSLYQRELANYKADPEAADKMANSEIGTPPAGLENADLAAWTVVANVLLNLDETITKG